MKKKLTALGLALAMTVGLTQGAFAANDNRIDEDFVTIEKLGDTSLYTYHKGNFTYSSQLEPNGIMIFSYSQGKDSAIYQSQPFNVCDYVDVSGNDKEDLTTINNWVMQNLDAFSVELAYVPPVARPLAPRAKSISQVVQDTFGSNYTNKFIHAATRTWEETYGLHCYASQSTYQLDGAVFRFAEKTAISVINTWIGQHLFKFDYSFLIAACSTVIKVYDGVKCIEKAISGEAYYYECDRIKNVKIPSYTDETIYSAYQKLTYNFIYDSGSGIWDISKEPIGSNTHSNYGNDLHDNTKLFDAAFNWFISNYLLP